MTRPTIETYGRELAFLDAAVAHKGCAIPLESYRHAVAYRHKLYRARSRYYETTKRPTYNDLVLKLRHEGEWLPAIIRLADRPIGAVEIVIVPRDISSPPPPAYDLAGNPIQMGPPPTAEDLAPPAFSPLDPAEPLLDEQALMEQAAWDMVKKLRVQDPE